jgi:hypothetical protein
MEASSSMTSPQSKFEGHGGQVGEALASQSKQLEALHGALDTLEGRLRPVLRGDGMPPDSEARPEEVRVGLAVEIGDRANQIAWAHIRVQTMLERLEL